MTKKVFYFVWLIIVSHSANAQDNDYFSNMLYAKTMIDTAKVENTLITAASYFERIALVNQKKWLPYYYAAYCYARLSHMSKNDDKRDKWVDKAQAEIEKAYKLDSKNSEILVMKGFVLQARMDINPMVRGFKYNSETMDYFDKAREIDSNNPRSYLWKGVNLFNTPGMFGGGKDKAFPLIKTAIEKYNLNLPKDLISPDWGYSYALEMFEKCK